MKTLQEYVEREVAKDIYEKAEKIMEMRKDNVKIRKGDEKVYPTVKDVPIIKSKSLDMILHNKDLIIKKSIETFEDGNGHSNVYIYYKDRNEIIPLFYRKNLVFEAERIHDSPYIKTNTFKEGYWRFCMDYALKNYQK